MVQPDKIKPIDWEALRADLQAVLDKHEIEAGVGTIAGGLVRFLLADVRTYDDIYREMARKGL